MWKRKIFFLILPCFIFFSLGLWQLFRLQWKKNIIKNINLPVTYTLPQHDLETLNYRHVQISGILSNIELYVFAGQLGYYVLSPMILSKGNYMLVNKGIVNQKEEREVAIEKVTLEGMIYCDSKKVWFIKNDIPSNTWFTFNTKEISNNLGIKLEKCILWQGNLNNKIAIQPTKHLEYAITWFLLTFSWFLMSIIYCKNYLKHKPAL